MIRSARLFNGGRVLLLAAGLLAGSLLPYAQAAAATTSTTSGAGNGLKVSPVVSNLTMKPGDTTTVDVFLTNVTGKPATFQVLINDFTASGDESGTPALVLDENTPASSHSLRKFIPPIANITLAANAQKDVKVPITVPADAAAGGYYGAVRFIATSTTSAVQGVGLSASVASLVLIKVTGNYQEQLSIASLDTRAGDRVHTIFTHPDGLNAVVRFRNTGDIQEIPFGKITITNFRGKTIYSTEINNGETPGNVLPDSIRKFSIPLKHIGHFGKYTITGDFGYGKGQVLTATTTFYVIPLGILLAFIGLILLIIFGIIWLPRWIKRYNARVLRRAGRR